MNKHCMITTIDGKRVAFFYENEQLCEISVLPKPEEEHSLLKLGNICTARIQNIVSNINSAFIDINGETCYYSLEDNKDTIFLNPKQNDIPHVGDEILVQIDREAVKTKNASASCYLNLTGETLILTWQHPGCGVSKKIPEPQRSELRSFVKSLPAFTTLPEPEKAGFVVRTNAALASREQLEEEARRLTDSLADILQRARSSVAGKCLYSSPTFYQDILNQIGSGDDNFILTDDDVVFAALQRANETRSNPVNLSFYDKEIPLSTLYSLEQEVRQALSKKVWLPSGGYLILEPTEALTVIDVNSGKSIYSKKKKEQHLLNLNLEAAQVIAKQLQLRNYSGIILIDFIDMQENENKERLLEYMGECLRQDSVKTTVVDITGLGLMELTRKKVKKPLHEQWQF